MEAFSLQTKTSTFTRKDLVEDYPAFSLSRLGRGLLHEDKIKRGSLSLTEYSEWPRALYETRRLSDGTTALRISFQHKASRPPSMHQEAVLEGVDATFGVRPYAICPSCGARRLKLLFSHSGRLSCRSCLEVIYQCCRENHAKPIFIRFRRCQRLRVKQLDVKRIDYAGKLTRKARSVIRMTKKWVY
jgi:hypothetical protein